MANGQAGLVPLPAIGTLLDLRQDPVDEVRQAARAALERLPLDADAATAAGTTPARPDERRPAAGFAVVDAPAGEARLDPNPTASTVQLLRAAKTDPALLTALLRDLVGRNGPADGGLDSLRAMIRSSGDEFRPDLDGLFALYRRLLERAGEPAARLDAARAQPGETAGLRRGIVWLISRGGASELLEGLDGQLGAADPVVRLAAACLLVEVGPLLRFQPVEASEAVPVPSKTGEPDPGVEPPSDAELPPDDLPRHHLPRPSPDLADQDPRPGAPPPVPPRAVPHARPAPPPAGRVHPLAVTGAASRAPSAGADPGPTRQARSARLRWSIAVGAVVLLALLLLLLLTGALS